MPTVAITEYTDPACPFAFSAEPHRLRLRWLFGEQLEWRERMIVLSERRDPNGRLTPEMAAKGAAMLHDRFGMPMDEEVPDVLGASIDACRAVVAARLHSPEHEWPLLRRLRHLNFAGGTLDDPALLERAARDVGLDPEQLAAWTAGEDVEAALREDMRLTRDPSTAALALTTKLSKTPEGGWRYSAPSYELVAGERTFSAPGMQSALNYETALANLAPDLERRELPEDAAEVLRWAGYPLATQEVAEVLGVERDAAREQLAAAGAVEERVGRDGFWTLP